MGPQCATIGGTLYPSQNGPGVAPAGLGVAPAGPSESLRIHCAEHICNPISSLTRMIKRCKKCVSNSQNERLILELIMSMCMDGWLHGAPVIAITL